MKPDSIEIGHLDTLKFDAKTAFIKNKNNSNIANTNINSINNINNINNTRVDNDTDMNNQKKNDNCEMSAHSDKDINSEYHYR